MSRSNDTIVLQCDTGSISLDDLSRQITPEWLKGQRTSGSVEDKNNQLQFEVYAQDGKLYQSEHQSGPDGQEIFRDTHELEWIIGAGENGFGGLIRQDAHLFQAPLSFYSKPERWELSPGYELGNRYVELFLRHVKTPRSA